MTLLFTRTVATSLLITLSPRILCCAWHKSGIDEWQRKWKWEIKTLVAACVGLKSRQLAKGWPEHLGAAEDTRCLGTREVEVGGHRRQHQMIL